MKRTQWRSLSAVGVLWLALGAGCQKDPPQSQSCDNGTCCMQDTRQYDYVETIENQPADLLGVTLIFKNLLPINNDPLWYNAGTGDKYKSLSAEICSLSKSKVSSLKNTVPLSGSNYPFRYRVWGKVYYDPNTQTTVATPVLFISIDRIDEVK